MPRVPLRLVAFVAAASVGVGVVLPAQPARAQANVPPFELTFPQEPAQTNFSDTFGAYRSGGRSHKGTDLLAPRMTEVYAVAAGKVRYVGINNLSGRNVKIDHGYGWETYYLHLNNDNPGTDDGSAPWTLTVAPGVEEGMRVEAGQLIGWVGDSGNAEWTTSHTHFELRLNGTALNAYSVLREAYERDYESPPRLRTDLPDYEID